MQPIPGETPVISSGIPVTGWKKLVNAPKELPEVAKGKIRVADIAFIRKIKQKQASSPTVATQMTRLHLFYTLYQENHQLQRARGPFFSASTKRPGENDDQTTFPVPEGVLKNWTDISNGELAIIPSRRWISNILPLNAR